MITATYGYFIYITYGLILPKQQDYRIGTEEENSSKVIDIKPISLIFVRENESWTIYLD